MPGEYRNKYQTMVGLVKQYLALPCSPSYLMYVDLTLSSVLYFGYSLASPDVREIITKATGRSALCHLKSGIHARKVEKYGFAGKVTSGLWHATEALDYATWWHFVFGVGANAAINWLSGAVKMSNCKDPPAPGTWGYGTRPYGGWPAVSDWGAGPSWRTADWPTTPGTPNTVDLKPGGWWSITGACQCQTTSGLPLPFNMRVFDETLGAEVHHREGDFDALEGSHMAFHFFSQNNTAYTKRLSLQLKCPILPPTTFVTLPWGHGYSRTHLAA